MWAQRFLPPQPDGSRQEAFDCERLCTLNGEFVEGEQAARNCALPWFDTSKWTGEKLWPIRLGRPPDYSRQHKEESFDDRVVLGEWHSPKEDLSAGCVGSFYRGAFVRSLLPYRRRRDQNGGRITNPLLDKCDNQLVHEAINTLEAFEDTALLEARATFESMKK